MTSSMSGNLPVILLGVTQLGLFASLLVAMTAAVAQSYTSGKNQLKPIQFVFNACTLLNAAASPTGLPQQMSRPTLSPHHVSGTGRRHLLPGEYGAGSEHHRLTEAEILLPLHKVFLWSFPNYVIGAGLTAIASAFTTVSGLATMAALMVVLFAVYQSYKTYVSQASRHSQKQ